MVAAMSLRTPVAAAAAIALALPLGAFPALADAPVPAAKKEANAAPTDPVLKAREDLRVVISSLRSARPNYDDMTPQLARRVASQLEDMTKALKELGYVSTVEYVGEVRGTRQFRVDFEHGTTDWFIARGKDGKLETLIFRRIADEPAPQDGESPPAPPAQ